ncbi:uncharacterized protein [Miscanthus floridulus]|uniref:uncharacterized protein n=1 Tax=Miscanthus floridulus TaxID=154761 RepID=UPI00345913D5
MTDDAEWLQIDACIVSWLYSTVSKDIWNDVYKPGNTVYAAWFAITGQFLDNSLQRAVYAQQEFHSLFQGDMSIGEYCGRLKRLTDTLYDCGAAVSDPALVINTLRGLNNKFSHAIAVLSTMTPPPTFLYTKSYLLQEEHRIKRSLEMEAQTTLLAAQDTDSSTTVNKAAPAPRPPSPAPASTTPSGGGGDRRKKRKADNRNRQSAPSSQPSHTAPPPPQWASSYNPWQGVVQAWPLNSWRPGLLAPRPGASPPFAMTALAAPPPQQYPGTIPPELYTALNGMSLNTPSGGGSDWFLDTGATSHMASHPGSTNQDGYPPM